MSVMNLFVTAGTFAYGLLLEGKPKGNTPGELLVDARAHRHFKEPVAGFCQFTSGFGTETTNLVYADKVGLEPRDSFMGKVGFSLEKKAEKVPDDSFMNSNTFKIFRAAGIFVGTSFISGIGDAVKAMGVNAAYEGVDRCGEIVVMQIIAFFLGVTTADWVYTAVIDFSLPEEDAGDSPLVTRVSDYINSTGVFCERASLESYLLSVWSEDEKGFESSLLFHGRMVAYNNMAIEEIMNIHLDATEEIKASEALTASGVSPDRYMLSTAFLNNKPYAARVAADADTYIASMNDAVDSTFRYEIMNFEYMKLLGFDTSRLEKIAETITSGPATKDDVAQALGKGDPARQQVIMASMINMRPGPRCGEKLGDNDHACCTYEPGPPIFSKGNAPYGLINGIYARRWGT